MSKMGERVPKLIAVVVTLLSVASGVWFSGTGPAAAKPETLARIAAVVDGQVITAEAVDKRLKLTVLSAGLSNDSIQRARLRDRIVRDLVDEALQRTAAREAGIRLPEGAVAEAYRRLAERNDMTPSQFDRALKQNGVEPAVLKRRLEANLLWQRYVSQELSRQVQISDRRIARYRDKLRANKGEPEYRLAEIVLSRDRVAEQASDNTSDGTASSASQDGSAQDFARDLVAQLRNGAEFSQVARQVSQAASASNGGKMGWVQPSQLSQTAQERLAARQVGEVTDPIVDRQNIHIYKLLDKRRILTPPPEEIQLRVNRLVLAQAASAAQIQTLRQNLQDCGAVEQAASRAAVARAGALGTLALADLSQKLQAVLGALEPGKLSPLVERNGQRELFMVCERSAPEVSLPSRQEVRQRLARQELNRLARQRLEALRQEAFIDVRL